MPRVSIIVPVYNCEPFLRECLDSALAQRFADLELILVDDGSPDGSGTIIDDYALKDSRIRIIHQENGGQSAARNAGLDTASGEYVYFLDSDDVMDPTLLETVIPKMDAGYELVTFGFTGAETPLREEKELILDTAEARFTFLAGPFRRRAVRWEVWNRVYRRDIIERWGLRFPADRRAYPEDMYFNLAYIAHISRILSIPDVLYSYRKHEGSISADVFTPSRQLMILSSNLMTVALEDHYRTCADCRYLSDHFLPLHYLLHKAAVRRLRRYHWSHSLSLEEVRGTLRDNVPDYPLFLRKMTAAYYEPVVVASYREDRGRLLQLTDRLYMGELLDIPVPRWKKLGRRFLLSALRISFRLKSLALRISDGAARVRARVRRG